MNANKTQIAIDANEAVRTLKSAGFILDFTPDDHFTATTPVRAGQFSKIFKIRNARMLGDIVYKSDVEEAITYMNWKKNS